MIVISEQDYAALKEQIKKELREEQQAKPESLNTVLLREQTAIFDRTFPDSMFPKEEISRRWKLRTAITTLTNVLRPRKRLEIRGCVYPQKTRPSGVHNEMEFDYALRTFEAVCTAAREIHRDDVTLEDIRDDA